jgi:hypothetical protein
MRTATHFPRPGAVWTVEMRCKLDFISSHFHFVSFHLRELFRPNSRAFLPSSLPFHIGQGYRVHVWRKVGPAKRWHTACSTMAHVLPSSTSPFEESPESSSSDDERDTKLGRPKKWTASRQRKLARLYIFSRLPPKDIPKVLQDDDWVPG